MLRIYLVPPGTGYFLACVCILIATAALYVGAGVAAGFPLPPSGDSNAPLAEKASGAVLCLGGVDQDGVGDQAGENAVELVEASGRVDGPAGL